MMIRDEEVQAALNAWFADPMWILDMSASAADAAYLDMRKALEAAAAVRRAIEQRERDERLTARDQQ